MLLSDTPFLEQPQPQPPLFYQPLLFYGKILNPPYLRSFENSTLSTLLITFFTIALIKCSVRVYSILYLIYFFQKVTFVFFVYMLPVTT